MRPALQAAEGKKGKKKRRKGGKGAAEEEEAEEEPAAAERTAAAKSSGKSGGGGEGSGGDGSSGDGTDDRVGAARKDGSGGGMAADPKQVLSLDSRLLEQIDPDLRCCTCRALPARTCFAARLAAAGWLC